MGLHRRALGENADVRQLWTRPVDHWLKTCVGGPNAHIAARCFGITYPGKKDRQRKGKEFWTNQHQHHHAEKRNGPLLGNLTGALARPMTVDSPAPRRPDLWKARRSKGAVQRNQGTKTNAESGGNV